MNFVRFNTYRLSRKFLILGAAFLVSLTAGIAQKTEQTKLEFPDRTVVVLVPDSIKVEKMEDSSIRLTYKVETYIDPEIFESRLFVEMTTTYSKPQTATTVTLDMSPFEKPATLHVWNPDDKAAYVTFEEGNPTVDLNTINYKGSEDKFSGEVKAIAFSTLLNSDIGDHVVEIRKFGLE